MASPPEAGGPQKAFIRLQSRKHFEATFEAVPQIKYIYPNSITIKPKYAEIRFTDAYLSTKNFQLYQRPYFRPRHIFWKFNTFPTKNMIYIMMSSGEIYSAILEKCKRTDQSKF